MLRRSFLTNSAAASLAIGATGLPAERVTARRYSQTGFRKDRSKPDHHRSSRGTLPDVYV